MQRVRITNISSMSISIEDMGILLAGKGSSAEASADSANRSQSLMRVSQHVRVTSIPDPTLRPKIVSPSSHVSSNKDMPLWPFNKPSVSPPPPSEPKSADSHVLTQMRDLLQELVSKQPSSLPPAIPQPQPTPRFEDLPPPSGPSRILANDIPIYVPGKIVPDVTDESIHPEETSRDKPNFNESKAALKRLKHNS